MRSFFAAVVLSIAFFDAYGASFIGKCVGVSDGDTISVMRDGEAVKVRLSGIDCPETKQDFGSAAKKATSALVAGAEVKVEWEDVDRYKRILGTPYVNGTNVCVYLVESGFAWHYTQYSSDSGLSRAEKAARKAKLGLWSRPDAVAPWEFRKTNKK